MTLNLKRLWLPLPPLLTALAAIFLMRQDANWDLRNYHWYNAYAALNGRFGFDLLPAQTPSFYNPLIDIPFYLLATHLPARIAVFALAFVQGLNFPLLYLLIREALPEECPWLRLGIAVLGVCGAGALSELGTTFYDTVVSLGVIGSALLALRATKRDDTKNLLRIAIAGLPVGLAMGLKQPNVVYAFGLTAAFLALPWPLRKRLGWAFAFGCGATFGLLLCSGYWMWFLWHDFHNPFFPYFNNLFMSLDGAFTSARDTKYIPGEFGEKLTLGLRMATNSYAVGEIDWQDFRIPIWWALMLALGVVKAGSASVAALRTTGLRNDEQKDGAARYLLLAGFLSYIAWLWLFSTYRYLIPLELLAPLLIVLACNGLVPWQKVRWVGVRVLLIVIACSIRPGDWGRVPWGEHFVEVQRPAIPDADQTMVLMTGYNPYSDVLPAFPPSIPIIRIESNFSSPDQHDKGINRRFAMRINEHKAKGGRFLVLYTGDEEWMVAPALTAFGLHLAPNALQNCRIVRHNLFAEDLHLCPVDPSP